MEIKIEIKYPGRGRGPLKPILPLSSIDSAISWLKLVEERVINSPEPSPWERSHALKKEKSMI